MRLIQSLTLAMAFIAVDLGHLYAAENVKIVFDANEQMLVELHAGNLIVQKTTINGEEFSVPKLDHFKNLGENGGPALPMLSRYFAMPDGTEPKIEIVSKEEEKIVLKHPVVFFEGSFQHCASVKIAKNPTAYDKFQNRQTLTTSSASYMGPIRASMLTFSPLRYDLKKQELTLTKKVIARIVFQKNAKKTQAPILGNDLDAKDYTFYRALLLNKGPFPAFRKQNRPSYELVIAHSSYRDSLNEFIKFKEEVGLGVIVKFFDQPTVSEIRDYIRRQYTLENPPKHTLLIGSIDQIPAFRRGEFWEDFKYSMLDSGEYPDLSLGRLPVRNPEQLRSMIKKIIAREKSPRTNGDFLLTSGFDTQDCQGNLRSIMENIFAYSSIDITVNKRYASEGFRTDSVIASYNENPNIIVYDGHGDETGMSEIPLYYSHLGRLTNTTYPLVMDIACLNSFWPSSGARTSHNFADSLAVLENTGAAGIFASSYYSGAHELFQHIFRAAIYDERNEHEHFHEINEFGSMVLYGKLKYLEEFSGAQAALDDAYMFYYLGDPASTFFQIRNH